MCVDYIEDTNKEALMEIGLLFIDGDVTKHLIEDILEFRGGHEEWGEEAVGWGGWSENLNFVTFNASVMCNVYVDYLFCCNFFSRTS